MKLNQTQLEQVQRNIRFLKSATIEDLMEAFRMIANPEDNLQELVSNGTFRIDYDTETGMEISFSISNDFIKQSLGE